MWKELLFVVAIKHKGWSDLNADELHVGSKIFLSAILKISKDFIRTQ
jgi:hypothetical protein